MGRAHAPKEFLAREGRVERGVHYVFFSTVWIFPPFPEKKGGGGAEGGGEKEKKRKGGKIAEGPVSFYIQLARLPPLVGPRSDDKPFFFLWNLGVFGHLRKGIKRQQKVCFIKKQGFENKRKKRGKKNKKKEEKKKRSI